MGVADRAHGISAYGDGLFTQHAGARHVEAALATEAFRVCSGGAILICRRAGGSVELADSVRADIYGNGRAQGRLSADGGADRVHHGAFFLDVAAAVCAGFAAAGDLCGSEYVDLRGRGA